MEHFALTAHGSHGNHARAHAHHGHVHGVADSAYVSTGRGLWALKWSFAIGAGAMLQLAVVMLSGSVALLADMIHNLADAFPGAAGDCVSCGAPSAEPAFHLRLRPAGTFAVGAIVSIILMSAIAAGYEAVHRLIDVQAVAMPGRRPPQASLVSSPTRRSRLCESGWKTKSTAPR